jgi:hypothetical protein
VHLQKTVEALQKNDLADQSVLYVFSDAPKAGDEAKVQKVRDYLKTIDGFKKVIVLERKENNRAANNRGGMRMLLEKYGKLIFLEEDVVTAPGFLEFINAGLTIYKDRKDIFAICGYTAPAQLERFYRKDVYLSPRFSGWGFGIWADRYEKTILDKIDFEGFIQNKPLIRRFRKGGKDLLPMLKKTATGKTDALDVRIFYTQLILNLSTVAPTRSLTNNIGHDGSGTHCRAITNRFEVSLPQDSIRLELDPDIQENIRVIKSLYRFRSSYHTVSIKRIIAILLKFIRKSISKGVLHL